MHFVSKTPSTTKKIAAKLAKEVVSSFFLNKNFKNQALVVALSGELGAGKTTFVQGFMKGLGAKNRIQSPTFVLLKKFLMRQKKALLPICAIHIDAYRLRGPKELEALGFKKELKNPNTIILLEWPERVKKLLPSQYVRVRFFHKKPNERTIIITESKPRKK